jgi:uncharacterized protein
MPAPNITIFPLGTVLFPAGVLPLRIFEARYVDMVRDCMRNDEPFGVCLITEGKEIGVAAEHESVGCAARIVNFDKEASGILSIRTLGENRFTILTKNITPQGLIKADVEWLNVETDATVPTDMQRCTELVEQVISELVDTEADPMKRVLEPPYLLKSASWISHRLCEILPFAPGSRQLMLEMNDPLERLAIVNQVLQKHAGTIRRDSH